ncbi:MAG: KamA family radical SAM protein [Candidatus Micrarchaeia archaeon]
MGEIGQMEKNAAPQIQSGKGKENNIAKENGKNFGKRLDNNCRVERPNLLTNIIPANGKGPLLEERMGEAKPSLTVANARVDDSDVSRSAPSEEWEVILRESATTGERLAEYFIKLGENFNLTQQEIDSINKVSSVYPMLLNKHVIELIRMKGDPIWDQFVPNEKELFYSDLVEDDPQKEEKDQPIPGVPLTHRYPDRVLLLVSNKCAAYCRHCTRKRRVGKQEKNITMSQIAKGVEYVQRHKEVRDVLLSGGDPLMLKDDELEFILQMIKSIKHVEIIRIGTRMPCTLPQRITPELTSMLKKYHPLYVNVQFNHPWELSKEARQACNMLADAGIQLGNQSVLLKGINDDPELYKSLCHELLKVRVKPYYLYQCDLVRGTEHFRVKTLRGLEIINSMKWYTTGFAVPKFVIDAPGGGGKVEIFDKNSIFAINEGATVFKNYKGEIVRYPEPRESIPMNEELAPSHVIGKDVENGSAKDGNSADTLLEEKPAESQLPTPADEVKNHDKDK